MNKFIYAWSAVTLTVFNINLTDLPLTICIDMHEFYHVALTICELEALSFQTADQITKLKIYYQKFNKLIENLTHISYDMHMWRIFIALFCSLLEWFEDTRYFSLTKERQDFIWDENPLVSFKNFMP